ATLRTPVDEDTAPRTTRNWLGGTGFRAPTEASVAAAPPLRPGSQEIAAPARVPRRALLASSRDKPRRGSSRCGGSPPNGEARPRRSPGIPNRPENRGKRTIEGSIGIDPRKVAIPRTPARA